MKEQIKIIIGQCNYKIILIKRIGGNLRISLFLTYYVKHGDIIVVLLSGHGGVSVWKNRVQMDCEDSKKQERIIKDFGIFG